MGELKTKTTADDLAFPQHPNRFFDSGLTKREYFAAMVMQGITANMKLGEDSGYETIAEWSVKQADALIEALNK